MRKARSENRAVRAGLGVFPPIGDAIDLSHAQDNRYSVSG